MMKWQVQSLRHAMVGWIWGEICPLLPMMQAIQLYQMDLNNPLEEKLTIICFDVEYFIKALEHLLLDCLIFLNINVRLWLMIRRIIGLKESNYPKESRQLIKEDVHVGFNSLWNGTYMFASTLNPNNNQAMHFISLIPSLFIQTWWHYQHVY